MSLHVIIDGYNLIKQTRLLNKINLEDSREALVRFLTIYRPQGSKGNRVTVVFDGREGNFYARPNSLIEVIFTREESADDRIKQLVEKSKNPRNIVVVTNDREIQIFVKHCKAQVKTVEEFMGKFNREGVKDKKDSPVDDNKVLLSALEAARITDEMKKLWLK